MKMKIFFNTIILLCFASLLSACDDENTQEEEVDFTLNNVHYLDHYTSLKYIPISTNDTIYSKVGRTLVIKVETISKHIEIQSTNKDMVEIKESEVSTESRKFEIYFKHASSTTINIIDSSIDKFVSFQVNIDPLIITYATINSPLIAQAETSYTIDITDNSLTDDILNELKDKFSLKKGKFIYTSLTDGEFEATMENEGNSIKGLFTTETVDDELKFNIYYNEKTYQIIAKQSDHLSNGYCIVQNLTQEFQTKYPSTTVNKIEISSFVLESYL